MLVLSRKLNESIIINGNIRVTIVGIRGSHVRVGLEAPSSVPILREELQDRSGCGALLGSPTGERVRDGHAAASQV